MSFSESLIIILPSLRQALIFQDLLIVGGAPGVGPTKLSQPAILRSVVPIAGQHEALLL